MNTDDLEKLLAERERIAAALRDNERALLEKHTRDQTVLFTDIVGSTRYFEEKGDVEGMKLLHRHNELLFPLVDNNRGKLIKTIGDAILATFDDPADGVVCAMQMHRTLREANNRGDGPQIHIRAGLHHGRVFLANNDVFGDTVNTAARVVHAAEGDEVLISQTLYSKLNPERRINGIPRGTLTLKGKAEPFAVVRINWEDASRSGEFAMPASSATGKAPQLFVLDIASGPKGLKVIAMDGEADKGTVKAYGEQDITQKELDEATRAFATFMHGGGAESYVPRIRAQGEALYDRALSERAKRHLRETKLTFLRLHLDDALVSVPWELMHDGKEFVGVRFALGRNVAARTEDTVAPLTGELPAVPAALIVANPSGDLPGAMKEGQAVAGLFRDGFTGKVTLLEGPTKRDDFIKALKGCTVLHFAGHIEQPTESNPGGFVLSDGLVTPSEVRKAVGSTAPGLVFANGCHATTGRGFSETAKGVSDLASALLLRGARHFVGPSWAVADEDALTFALRFYEKSLSGVAFGEACRLARVALLAPTAQPLSFAGYVLYGEPRSAFAAEHTRLQQKKTRSILDSGEDLRVNVAARPKQPEATAPAADSVPKTKLQVGRIAGAVGVVALIAGVAVFATRGHGPTETPSKPVGSAQQEAPPLPKVAHEGPIRITVLPFKNVSGDKAIDYLQDTMAETVTTDFSGEDSIRLIERGQLKLNIDEIEFGKGEYVDKATRAEIGKINGAEVAVMGGFQKAGKVMRANARFVNVETGEVLSAVKVERPTDDLLELQDAVSEELRKAVPTLKGKLRP
ncbi:MAG: CHAT domain-containing protein [Myxococcaceae bacterium]